MAAAGSFQHKTSSSCIYSKELWAGFEGTIQARCQCPINNNNLENFILSIFSIASHGQEMCQSILQRTHKLKLTVKINRSSFWGYHCKSDIVIFVWRVTWNYAYSPYSIHYRQRLDLLRSNTKFNPFNKKIKCLNSYILLIEYAF